MMIQLLRRFRARREDDPDLWAGYARACLNHPVCRLLHQDPLTYRAFSKPRGYAGDAVMMDYIYGLGEAVRQILSGKANPGQFDFVYAGGLFDYLSAATASALTRKMFEMTRPGGLMLIPNFLAGARDSGYMESFMNWHLVYRDHAAMQALADVLPPTAVAECNVFDDETETITFLLVAKARLSNDLRSDTRALCAPGDPTSQSGRRSSIQPRDTTGFIDSHRR
jgi:hypothetical protein